MKIIISHDIDHLYPSDHFFKDLIFPKLWVRSFLEFVMGKMPFTALINRIISIFDKRLNRIPEIMEFDKEHTIPSTFFIGMANGLGLSYSLRKAEKWLLFIMQHDFDIGVHGIDFENPQKEHETFKKMSGLDSFGIRTHYVRYNSDTFCKFAKTGYLFDCSEFNKYCIELKDVHRIDSLWEFPLHIMDGYVLKQGFEKAVAATETALRDSALKGISYFSFLFHDYMFNEKTYPVQKKYYEWFVNFCMENGWQFISYKQAINELAGF